MKAQICSETTTEPTNIETTAVAQQYRGRAHRRVPPRPVVHSGESRGPALGSPRVPAGRAGGDRSSQEPEPCLARQCSASKSRRRVMPRTRRKPRRPDSGLELSEPQRPLKRVSCLLRSRCRNATLHTALVARPALTPPFRNSRQPPGPDRLSQGHRRARSARRSAFPVRLSGSLRCQPHRPSTDEGAAGVGAWDLNACTGRHATCIVAKD